MKKLLAFYMLIIGIEKAFAQAAIGYDEHKEFFPIVIGGLLFFGLVWIISKIVKSHSNKKKEIEESQRREKIQNGENKNGVVNRHGYVDLGLSVKWATCNVGASSPIDYGNYYAWGETSTKSSYTQENSKMYETDIENIAGNPEYDAATANWGSPWRLPTDEEINELVNKCSWEWTTQGGHNGCIVTGPNGNSIFLPAASQYYKTSLNFVGEWGDYWSAFCEEDTEDAYSLSFHSSGFGLSGNTLYCGCPIRPVTK